MLLIIPGSAATLLAVEDDTDDDPVGTEYEDDDALLTAGEDDDAFGVAAGFEEDAFGTVTFTGTLLMMRASVVQRPGTMPSSREVQCSMPVQSLGE